MTLIRALLLTVVAAGALVLPMAEQIGFGQVWELSEVEDGEDVEDDADGPTWIELQVASSRARVTTAADLEPVALERDGVRPAFERPPRG
jgi:hypothetical protein